MKRLIAVGDIHGRLPKLNYLMNKVRPHPDDQIVFLGDYIDRGPQSKEVIDYLLNFAQAFPKTVFLRGNHEQLFLDVLVKKGLRHGPTLRETSLVYRVYAHNDDLQIFLANGGRLTLLSYGINGDWNIPAEHITFLENTRRCYREDPYLFVHAGAEPGIADEDQDPFVLLWSRFPSSEGDSIQVVGHTVTSDGLPKFEKGRISLDTGAGIDGPLTACDVLTGEVWQVDRG